MSPEFLDRYSRSHTSPLHRLDPTLKLVVALVWLAAIALGPWPQGAPPLPRVSALHLVSAVLLAIGVALAKLPWRFVLGRLVAVAPVFLLLGLSLPLSHGWRAGLPAMAAVVARGCLSFGVLLVLVNTTPFEALLAAMGRLGVPRLFVAVLGFMYRYLFVLSDELARMRRARAARDFSGRWWSAWRGAPSLVGMLLARSVERSGRVHAAMLSRGYDGSIRTLPLADRSAAKPR